MVASSDERMLVASRGRLCKILEQNSNFLSNVLVMGCDRKRRELVARMFHAAMQKRSVFTMVRCDRESKRPNGELLDLFLALTRNTKSPRSRTSELLSGGTLFIDEVDCMDQDGQRICLEFLKQLQRVKRERPGEVELRVIGGISKDLNEAMARGGFLTSLLDQLDKVRVELDGSCEEESESESRQDAVIAAQMTQNS